MANKEKKNKRSNDGGAASPAPMKGIGGYKPSSGNKRDKAPYAKDIVKLMDWPSVPAFVQMRILPPNKKAGIGVVTEVKRYVDITANGKTFGVPKIPLNYNAAEDSFGPDEDCPYAMSKNPSKISQYYYVNVIVRDLQDDEPKKVKMTDEEKKTGIADISSGSWSPVRMLRLTAKTLGRIQELTGLNMHKTKDGKEAMGLDDAEYGNDILMKFDIKASSPGDMYAIELSREDAKTPLTKAEQKYLVWDVSSVNTPPLDFDAAVKDVGFLEEKCPDAEEEDDDAAQKSDSKYEGKKDKKMERKGKKDKGDKKKDKKDEPKKEEKKKGKKDKAPKEEKKAPKKEEKKKGKKDAPKLADPKKKDKKKKK